MKIVNIILSILILLLSAATAVFSYFLFEKRSQFVSGWAKLAQTISSSAAELDKGTGTEVAKKLTPQALSHENYGKMDALLGELPKQSKQIIVQRNNLADTLARVSSASGMKDPVSAAKLSNINSYGSSRNVVVRGVQDVVSNRDRTYNNLIEIARSTIRVPVDRGKLLSGDASAFNEFKGKLRAIDSQKRFYEDRFREIARKFRVSIALNEKNYSTELKKVTDAVNKYQSEYNSTKSELNKTKQVVVNRDRQIVWLQKNIANQKVVIADRDGQIASFQRALALPAAEASVRPWASGSAEARAQLVGSVIAVNPKYGYIAIDFGKYSVVQQNIGNRVLEVNPNVEPGMALIITRKEASKSDFITKVTIAKVGETTSIADIPSDAKPIKVGDVVRVSVEDLPKPAAPAAPKKAPAKSKNTAKR